MPPASNPETKKTAFRIALERFPRAEIHGVLRVLHNAGVNPRSVGDWLDGKCKPPERVCAIMRELLEQRAADDLRASSQLLPGPGRGSRGHEALGRWRAARTQAKEKARI